MRLAPVTAAAALLPLWWLIATPTEDLAVVVRLVIRCTFVSIAYLGMVWAMSDVRADVLLLVRRHPPSPDAAAVTGEALTLSSPTRSRFGRAR